MKSLCLSKVNSAADDGDDESESESADNNNASAHSSDAEDTSSITEGMIIN